MGLQRGWVITAVVVSLLIQVSLCQIPTGELYAFGKLGKENQSHNLGEFGYASLFENSTNTFRTAFASPNFIQVSTFEGKAAKIDSMGLGAELTDIVDDPEGYGYCQVCKGTEHVIAVTCSGDGFIWATRPSYTRTEVKILEKFDPIPLFLNNTRILQITCGESHSLILTENRMVYAIGLTELGRLGIDSIPQGIYNFDVPQPIYSISPYQLSDNDTVCFVEASGGSSFAVTESGKMYVWGNNEFGQLGFGNVSDPISTPTLVESDFNACEVSSGESFAMGYDINGDFWSWGAGPQPPKRFGQTDSTKDFFSSLTEKIIMVAAGEYHGTFLTDDKNVYSFGYNGFGQLGVKLPDTKPTTMGPGGEEPDSPLWTLKPRKVEYLEGKNIASIFAAGNYTLVLSNVLAPMNCKCARGGREPTKFHTRSKPPVPSPLPTQPIYKPSDVFAPVEPFGRRKRIQSVTTLPGEVEFVDPKTMKQVEALDMAEKRKGTQNVPELAKKAAALVYYPENSNEQKAFEHGLKKGESLQLFGAHVNEEGYFYGDYDNEVESEGSGRLAEMPSSNDDMSLMPEKPKVTKSMSITPSKLSEREIGTFSLSLQDIRAPRMNGDFEMKKSAMETISEFDDNHPVVDFNKTPLVTMDDPSSELLAITSGDKEEEKVEETKKNSLVNL